MDEERYLAWLLIIPDFSPRGKNLLIGHLAGELVGRAEVQNAVILTCFLFLYTLLYLQVALWLVRFVSETLGEMWTSCVFG